jgi:hypothetical protein
MVRLSLCCVGIGDSAAQIHLSVVHQTTKTDGSGFFSAAE